MSSANLRYRQVHLDFHTSADCQGVGEEFDPRQFAQTVQMGHVDSVTVFARCHHGYSYYPTQVGTQHPNLSFDLMGQQIEVLHSVGVRAPIYVTIMWDDLAGQQHPEWVLARKDGTLVMRPPLTNQSPVEGGWGWTTLDVSSGYGDYVLAQVQEICERYPVDGFFFDINLPLPNYSPWGQARMRDAGVSLDDDAAVQEYAASQLRRFFDRLTTLVLEKAPEATIFYNGTVNPGMTRAVSYQTHLEIESLPTSSGIWGYLHYPLMARQARTHGLDFLGMTGRFHKAWGDFGGLKTRDQLDYECGTIVAAGGRISVGDQLHPRGVLDPAVYRLLAHSFGRIENLEPWLRGATPTAEIGILTSTQAARGSKNVAVPSHDAEVEGAAQMFLESAIQFDILDPEAVSLDRYQTLVLPEGLRVNEALHSKLEVFVQNGGKLVHSGTAGLNPETQRFDVPNVSVEYLGLAPTTPSYIRPDESFAQDSELETDYDYVFYGQSHEVRAREGTIGRGELKRALFTRTWEHFTSHAQAPVGDSLQAPVVVQNDSTLYFAAPLFSAYREHDYWAYRAIAITSLRAFLPSPLVRTNAPGWVEITLHTQPAEEGHLERRVVHIVVYHPRRTMQPIQHVDQGQLTAGLYVEVLSHGKAPGRVYLAPDREPVLFSQEAEYTRVELPPVAVHTVLVLE